MAQTYTQIQRQIEALQKQAEKLKASEVKGVVERIKVAIEHYDLTAEQLFGSAKATSTKAKKGATKKTGGVSKTASSAAYADDNGNSWGGRGPRPKWLRDAIAGGKLLEDFAISTSSAKSVTGATKKVAGKNQGKRKAKTTYRDDNGNSWSGLGPKPAWLKEAIAAGKSLGDFAAPAKN